MMTKIRHKLYLPEVLWILAAIGEGNKRKKEKKNQILENFGTFVEQLI